jgi:hypothetical protein
MSLPYNSGTAPTTLCCQCGVPIVWNPQNLCTPCIALLVDIAEDIPKDGMVTWCRTCGRFLNPPNHWMPAALESKELLGLCLKRIRGLNKVRLVDARWIWTEPHSNRLKIELTIQKVYPRMIALSFGLHQFTHDTGDVPERHRTKKFCCRFPDRTRSVRGMPSRRLGANMEGAFASAPSG